MPRKKRLKDIDLADRAQRLQAGAWAFAVASTMGTIGGGGVAYLAGWNPIVGAVLGFVTIFSGVYFGSTRLIGGVGEIAGSLHNPSGKSTPPKREYSRAQSLVARGLYEEAAIAYEVHCIEHPEDPEPFFRIARLLRDRLQRYDDAVSWLRRARTDAKLSSGQELVITQEIIELYMRKLGTPRKAMPELASICKNFPDTPAAEGARRELAEMRKMLERERDGEADFTQQFLARFKDPTPDDVEPS
jgi:hypothetical protein